MALRPAPQNDVSFPCRWRRLFCSGQEHRPGGDNWTGASEGQRVLVKCCGPRWSGQPRCPRHALSDGRSQSAAIYQHELRHLYTREHTRRTAVSTTCFTLGLILPALKLFKAVTLIKKPYRTLRAFLHITMLHVKVMVGCRQMSTYLYTFSNHSGQFYPFHYSTRMSIRSYIDCIFPIKKN